MQPTKNNNVNLVSAAEIILTDECNLKCKYCYSAEHRSKQVISCEKINEIVEMLCRNAFIKKALGISHNVNISFLGGGEPTLAWYELQYCIECLKRVSQKYDVIYDLSITTNGCFSLDKLNYLMNENVKVKVSIDGLEEINNYTRIDKAGNGTYDMITASVDYLNNSKKWFSLGVVVGTHNYVYLEDFVRYVIERWKNIKKLDFSYLQETEKTIENGLKAIDYVEFLKIKNRCIKILVDNKIGVYNQYMSINDFLVNNKYYRCPKVAGDKIVINCDNKVYKCTRLVEPFDHTIIENRKHDNLNCLHCDYHEYCMLYNDNCIFTNDKEINKTEYCEFVKKTYSEALAK